MGDADQALNVMAKPALILRRDIPVDDVVRALALLPPPQQTLAIRAAYIEAVDGLPAGEAEHAKEQHGRRIEAIVDGLEPQALLDLMVKVGDSELLLDMVRGRVGDVSTAVQYLSARHFAEFYMTDADMNRGMAEYGDYQAGRDSRLIQTAWTFVMETPLEHNGVNLFFFKTERGQSLVRQLEDLAAKGDENAKQIVARLRERERRLVLDEVMQAELNYIEEMEEHQARRLEGAVR